MTDASAPVDDGSALAVRELRVSFDPAVPPAVDGATFDVMSGETVAILGPSGSGKSTLLRAIAGLERLDAGTVSWRGGDLASVPVHRRGFALMFQDGQLFPHRDAASNIAYPLQIAGMRAPERRRRVDELLELVGLAGLGGRAVPELSGGQQQRVALARSLAARPRLLLLDEPLSSLDRELRDRLAGDLRRILTTTSTTALLVTHDQEEAFTVADRVGIMIGGALVRLGRPDEVWRTPGTWEIARFLGYTTLVDRESAHRLVPGAESALALRPAALVVEQARTGAIPSGRLVAAVLRSAESPGGIRLKIEVAGLGAMDAIAAPGLRVETGTSVLVRFDPSASAVVAPPASAPSDPAPIRSAPGGSG